MYLAGLALPASVARAATERWLDDGATWARHVEGELHWVCQRCHATPIRILPARYSYVVEAKMDNTSVVLRSTPDPDARFSASVSEALAQLGVGPRVHTILQTATGCWTVTDMVLPGLSLYEVNASTAALAEIFGMMQGHRSPDDAMPDLYSWLRVRLNDDDLSDLPAGQTVAPVQQRQQAEATLDSLSQTSVAELCHGDASPGNILTGTQGFQLIDPRGLQGEVAYDIAVVAMKTTTSDEVHRHAAQLAQLASVDVERVQAWIQIADAARV